MVANPAIHTHPIHWALVADGGRARVYRLRRSPREFDLLATLESGTLHEPSRNLDADASGRTFHAQGPSAHAMQPRTDAHEQEEQKFVESLAEKLDRAAARGDFDYMMLVADSRTLGRIRKAMSPALARRVITEKALDLTNAPEAAVEKSLRRIMDWPA